MLPFSEILLEYLFCLRHPRALNATALLHILVCSEARSNCDTPFQSIQVVEDSEKEKLIIKRLKKKVYICSSGNRSPQSNL